LIANSYLVGACTVALAAGRAFPLGLTLSVFAQRIPRPAVHPADARAIARERTKRRELPNKTYGKELVPVSKRDNLLTPIQQDRICPCDECIGFGS